MKFQSNWQIHSTFPSCQIYSTFPRMVFYIGCRVFVDLQKAIGSVDHQILLAILNHYGIRGVSNNSFKSYLSNRHQYVPINGYESGLAAINCGVSQGSVQGSLLFLLYINDLNQAIKFCKIYRFADDTNLLCLK